MHISIRDSATAGFKKWSAARPSVSIAKVSARATAAVVSPGRDAVIARSERAPAPVLVPGPGTLCKTFPGVQQ